MTPTIRAALRATATAAFVLLAYFLLPLHSWSDHTVLLILLVGVAAVGALLAWQIRSILGSPNPLLRVIEALAVSVPLFLVVFAVAYYVAAGESAGNFGQPLTRTSALYFAVTVFSTTGFGDIAARSDLARALVTVQMLGDMIFLGIGLRVLVTAGRIRVQNRSAGHVSR